MAPSRHAVFLSVGEMGTFRQPWQRCPVRRVFIAKVPYFISGVVIFTGRAGKLVLTTAKALGHKAPYPQQKNAV